MASNIATIASYSIRSKKLSHWEPLIEEWILSIERYSRLTNGDAPYLYNERANVGVLAGAAWRCGRIALEEFQSEKSGESLNEQTGKVAYTERKGRCDLWICDEQSDEEVIEAKFKWVNMLSSKKGDLAEICLRDAVGNARTTRGREKIRSIGTAFLPVYANSKKIKDTKVLETKIADTIQMAQGLKADLVAWCFPKRLREYVGEEFGNYLPGVILLAKEA